MTYFSQMYFKWQNALVRELAWCIGSAPLMAGHVSQLPFDILGPTWSQEHLREHSNWLDSLDQNPKILEDSMPTGKLLLGKRFEHLIGFWLRHSPHFKILASNHVFQGRQQTMGELDFLVSENNSGRNLHIEVACKFYLSANESPQWKYWIGPGQKDTLRLKMDKLVKQLSILKTPEGKDYLKEQRIARVQPCLLMKGYFFHHFEKLSSSKAPKGSDTLYPSGWWLKTKELPFFLSQQRDTFWTTLPKKSWLAPFRSTLSDQEVWNDYEAELELAEHFKKWGRPIMVIKVTERNGHWEELSRGFLVGNDWGSQV